tara:strand:- start:43 stop:513 length:471 start_codon:yes stop_codon:yes gene_type:complete
METGFLSFIKRKISKKAQFKYQSDLLMHYDKILSEHSRNLYDLFVAAEDAQERKLLRASFVNAAGLVRLIREDLNIIFDRFYSPSKRIVSTRVDLKRLRDEAEILTMLFKRADHPKPLLDRAVKVREVFAQTLGSGVDIALESQCEELLQLIKSKS